jgi:hypothetical protein
VNVKLVLGVATLVAFSTVGGGAYYFGARHANASTVPTCVAGVNEICPSDEFRQEVVTFKALNERQKALSQDPKVKELVSVIDQQRGMGERMQQEINQTLQANPGHQWDGAKEKFVPAPILQPKPAETPAAPPKK